MAAKQAVKKTAPKRVNPEHKLTAPQIDILGVLHENDRWHDLATIVADSGVTEKEATKVLKNLVDREYLTAKEDGTAWRFLGNRCKALKLAVGALRLAGEPLPAGEVGAAIWGDPKKAATDPKANTRYMAAASAVLSTAFLLGVVYRVESDGPVLFGAVA